MRSALLPGLLVTAQMCAWAQAGISGQTVDELTLSVAIVRENGQNVRVRVTLQHSGDRPKLVPLAFATGEDMARYRLRLFVGTAEHQYAFRLEDDKLIRGRFDPLVIPLAPNSSYALDVPISEWHPIVEFNHPVARLADLVKRMGHLWVEWDGSNWQGTAQPTCPLYGYPNPNGIPCWGGKLVSNRLPLPSSPPTPSKGRR